MSESFELNSYRIHFLPSRCLFTVVGCVKLQKEIKNWVFFVLFLIKQNEESKYLSLFHFLFEVSTMSVFQSFLIFIYDFYQNIDKMWFDIFVF